MLTTGDLAKLLHVSSQTVINWLDQGRIPFERISSGPRRVREVEALRYIKESRLSPESLEQSIYQEILAVVSRTSDSLGEGHAVAVVGRDGRILVATEAALMRIGRSLNDVREDAYNRWLQLSDAQTQAPLILHKSSLTQSGPMELLWQRAFDPHIKGKLVASPYQGSVGELGGWVLSFRIEP